MEIVKSISFSQPEILRNIVALHTGDIECDVCYGSGCFYKNGIEHPKFCFDIAPRKPGVISANVCRLPLKDQSIRSIIFDPPFLVRTGPGATLKARFGEIVGTIQDLWAFYFQAIKEMHRVLLPGGWLIFKNQDGVLSGKNNFTHAEIYNMSKVLGFIPVDLFVLMATHRMTHPAHKRQIHARKFHSYFWVFKKKRLRTTPTIPQAER
ncbi:MAG: hypothetical protein WC593_15710 [Methanoregula sp.]